MLLGVCFRDTFSLLAAGSNILPVSLSDFWINAETFSAAALGQRLPPQNPLRHAVTLYLNAAGIDAGYGFFAPNVPNNYKLVFEIIYPDGHREYDLPRLGEAGTGFRLESFLDRIAETNYQPLRQMMFKMLADGVWQNHHEATAIRAVFGYTIWPSPDEFERGEKGSFEPVYAYDFTFAPAPSPPPDP